MMAKEQKKETVEELLAAELAGLRIVPGNESHKYAKVIVELVHKFDAQVPTVEDQLASDDMDIEELLKNDKAIMGGIVSMSKLVTAMHDTIKRHFEASMTITGGGGTSGGQGSETQTSA
jgi:hypothetical protein